MNFSQLHERLRLEAAHRIHRGLLTGSLLARQTGLQPSHISNFLRRRRKLSLGALDRVLAALSLNLDELALQTPSGRSRHPDAPGDAPFVQVPLVSSATAIRSSIIHRAATLELVHLPLGALDGLRPRHSSERRLWQRFVAVRVTADQAAPMSPLLRPQSIAVLDRQYNSLVNYRPLQPNVFAVHTGDDNLLFRYVRVDSRFLILRPHAREHPAEVIEIGEDASPSGMIVGRVCVSICPL